MKTDCVGRRLLNVVLITLLTLCFISLGQILYQLSITFNIEYCVPYLIAAAVYAVYFGLFLYVREAYDVVPRTITYANSSDTAKKNDDFNLTSAERLKKLKTLLDEELITEDEYKAKREELLKEI